MVGAMFLLLFLQLDSYFEVLTTTSHNEKECAHNVKNVFYM